jgi:hypothetical protein
MTSWTSARYDRDPSRYQPDLHQRNRVDLLAKIRSTLSTLAINQFKLLRKDYLEAFEQELVARMSQDECHFADLVGEVCHRWESKFEESAREVSVEGTELKWKHELGLLKTDVGKQVDRIREDEIIKVSEIVKIGETLFKHDETRHTRWCWQNSSRMHITSYKPSILELLSKDWGNQ